MNLTNMDYAIDNGNTPLLSVTWGIIIQIIQKQQKIIIIITIIKIIMPMLIII